MKTKLLKNMLLFLFIAVLCNLFCTDWDLGADEDDPPDPVTLEIIGVADTTVTLRWTQSQDEGFESYKVYYSLSDIVDTTDKIADTIFFSHDTVKTVKPLDPEKHYYFRVIVSTTRNLISASNIVDTTTLKSFTNLKLELLQPDTLEDITESSVILQWKKNWIEEVTRYFVYMDTSASVDSLDTTVATIYDGEATTIEGLERLKDYWFRVFLDRNGIPSAGSNVIKITTTSGVPEPVTLDSITDADIKDTAITIRWSKSRDDDFLRYIVYYDTISTVDTFTSYTSIDTTSSRLKYVTDVNDTVLEISPLKRDTTYWFAVYVQDSTNFIKTSNKQSAKTKEGKPTGVALYIDSTSDTSAYLHWTMNADDDFYRYVVYFNDTLNIDTITEIDTTDIRIGAKVVEQDDTTATILPLERNEKYWFVVYVEDMTGFITKSNIDTAVTDDGYPTPVTLQKTNVTDTTITLFWNKNIDKDFKCYQIYSNAGNSVDSTGNLEPEITNNSDTSLTIGSLKKFTQYAFIIYVKNNSNFRSGSNIILNYPIILDLDSSEVPVTDSVVKLKWGKTLRPSSKFLSYKVFYSDRYNFNDTTGILDTTIHNLADVRHEHITDTNWVEYYYKVYVNFINDNDIGDTECSNTLYVVKP
jgi:hypothetical protein